MDRPPVSDASPLIFLARGDHMDFFRLVGDELLVPRPVVDEVVRRGPEDVAARAIRETPWIRAVDPPPVGPAIQAWDLGPGESGSLAWAEAHPGTELIIDDRAGRRCAASLGIPVRGTLGLVLLARARDRIPAARPVLEELRRSGMYLSDDVLEEAPAPISHDARADAPHPGRSRPIQVLNGASSACGLSRTTSAQPATPRRFEQTLRAS